jgi:tetratricopeptide (TPR) repeat protein
MMVTQGDSAMRLLIPVLLLSASVSVYAAGAEDPAPAKPVGAEKAVDKLAGAKAHLVAKRWPEAITELRRVNDSTSADWNNLMGYALRKQATPDLAAAQQHYDTALKISPTHRGALEYSGELLLMKGELAQAEQRLATLARACNSACEEHADLKKAVERFKAAGNKYVAEAR